MRNKWKIERIEILADCGWYRIAYVPVDTTWCFSIDDGTILDFFHDTYSIHPHDMDPDCCWLYDMGPLRDDRFLLRLLMRKA